MLTLRVKGDLQVCVPDNLRRMTPYVLLEQEDWFEDEIGFVRRLIQPGSRVIDIGANYGLYTLTLARCVTAAGTVWAFEPATTTADYLQRSMALNGFDHIHVIQAALSAEPGQARLSLYPDAETNSLVFQAGASDYETVDLLTLDDCAQQYGWQDIDFVKLDAEGEEQRIIRGGERFLAENSPLLMFELRHGASVNHALIDQFAALGYTPYRLLPGLQQLAPLDNAAQNEPSLLNIFVCKPDCARELEKRALLSRRVACTLGRQELAKAHWRQCLGKKAYYRRFRIDWDAAMHKQRVPGREAYGNALALFCLAHSDTTAASLRAACLEESVALLEQSLARQTNISRLQTYARILSELGRRAMAMQVLHTLIQQLSGEHAVKLPEPFIPVAPRFDHVPLSSKRQATEWCLSGIIEQQEKLGSWSSYFLRDHEQVHRALQRLDYLRTHSFYTPEMERRRQLIKILNGKQIKPEASEMLEHDADDNLNAEIWR